MPFVPPPSPTAARAAPGPQEDRPARVPAAPGHAPAAASDWLLRWAHLLPPGARVLDVACGHGRHVHWLAASGHHVTAIDRDAALLAPLRALATTVTADLEADPWPLPGRHFDLVLVTNYLWRPLLPALRGAVAPGGLLIYETFAKAHAALGRPRRPEFLLDPGELLVAFGTPGRVGRRAAGPATPDAAAEPSTNARAHCGDAALGEPAARAPDAGMDKPSHDPSFPADGAADAWHVIAFEEGRLPTRGELPEREVQRIVARRAISAADRPDHLLPPG